MKIYRFSELSHSAQVKAVYDYLIGWEVTELIKEVLSE